jgi:hypothetical protein
MLEAVAAYVRRRHWVVFSLVALFVVVDFGRWLLAPAFMLPGSGPAVDLAFGIAVELAYVAAIFYSLRSRDFWGYTVVAALIILSLSSAAMWLGIYIKEFGITSTFEHSTWGIKNDFRVAQIIVSIPTLVAVLALWRPLYRERSEIRKLTDTGLVNRYVDEARALYRLWMQRDRAAQDEANRKMALIYSEVKRRDPSLVSLYALLKEPDDWVRIAVARQLLSKKNNAALDVLDAIARQHSEFSGFAQRMAAQWRKGELKAWG